MSVQILRIVSNGFSALENPLSEHSLMRAWFFSGVFSSNGTILGYIKLIDHRLLGKMVKNSNSAIVFFFNILDFALITVQQKYLVRLKSHLVSGLRVTYTPRCIH